MTLAENESCQRIEFLKRNLILILYMTVNTALAGIDTFPGVMALPAALVDNHLGAERLVGEVTEVRVMTLTAQVVHLVRFRFRAVA